MANIETPDGIALQLDLESGSVSIASSDGKSFSFSAELIPEVRAVLLDFEAEHWGAK